MRNMITSALAAAAMAVVGTMAQAAPVNLADMVKNGSAAMSGTDLILTPASGSQSGSAYIADAVSLSAGDTFSAAFEFMITGTGSGADGLAFILQNSGAGSAALGLAGGGLGYMNVSPSVVVEFDTWSNGGVDDGSTNHVGINLDGDWDSIAQANPAFLMENNQQSRFAWVDYDGSMLSVFLSDIGVKPLTALVSAAVDLTGLGGQAFVGFTAATGGAVSQHSIKSFDFTSAAAPAVPLPASVPLMLGGLALLAGVARRRS